MVRSQGDAWIPFPPDAYLAEVGRIVYAVGYLEWGILGGLLGLQARLAPADLTAEALAGSTTKSIARAIEREAPHVPDPAVRAWLEESARWLLEVSDIRNAALGARPATIDGEQRLYRWRRIGGRVDAFPITDEWLSDAIARVEAATRAVAAIRPS